MTDRQKKILDLIIHEYIKTAYPAGSEDLSQRVGVRVSSATIRNEMTILTEEGYLYQPHTSAGRVPTLLAFQGYIQSMKEKKLTDKERKLLKEIKKEKLEREELMKQFAKVLAQLSSQMMILAINPDHYFYTGFANLFNQPEFSQQAGLCSISQMVDHLDGIMEDMFHSLGSQTEVLLGEDNPFSEFCGTVISRYNIGSQKGIIGLIGPIRMDYAKNLSLINFTKELLVK